jgi:hypothetical protein
VWSKVKKRRKVSHTSRSSTSSDGSTCTTTGNDLSDIGSQVGSEQGWPVWLNRVASGGKEGIDLIRGDLGTTIVKG